MKVEELPIPKSVKEVVNKSGITDLYPPQEEAIRAGALEGRNLVLASPTASGKTLIAELCALKHILERDGKVLYLTPLRALASEKYQEFKKYTTIRKRNGRRITVGISTGDYDSVTGDMSILVQQDDRIGLTTVGQLVDRKIAECQSQILSGEKEVCMLYDDRTKVFAISDDGKVVLASIRAVIRHKTRKPIYEIETRTGRKIKVTGDHCLFTLDENRIIKPTKVDDLKENQSYIAVPRLLPYPEKPLDHINLLEHLDEFQDCWITGCPVKDMLSHATTWRAVYKKYKNDKNIYYWKRKGLLPIKVLIDLSRNRVINLEALQGKDLCIVKSHARIPAVIDLDDDFMTFIGLWLADGSYYKAGVSVSSGPDVNCKRVVKAIAERFNVRIAETDSGVTFILGSRFLRKIMSKIMSLKGNAYTKKVPSWIFSLSDNQIASLLKGYFSGDGSAVKGEITALSYSPDLLRHVQTLLLRLGIISSVKTKTLRIPRKWSVIFGRKVKFLQQHQNEKAKSTSTMSYYDVIPLNGNFAKKAGFRWAYYVGQANILRNTIERLLQKQSTSEGIRKILKKLISSHILWDKVIQIKKLNNQETYVYDLSVPPHENFICENVVAKNSSDPWLERHDIIITSVDYEEPSIIRENRVTKIVKIGEFIDDLMRTASNRVQIESETEVLDVSNLNLETIAFDPEDFKLTFRKVSKVVRHKVDAPLYRLKLETGRGVTVTGSHSVYTLDGLNVIAKRVSKIRAGDLVLTPRRFPLSPSEDPEINLARELGGLRKAENLFVKKIPKSFFESSAFEDLRAKAYDKKNWKKRRELPLAKVIALGLDRELSASRTFFSYTASRHKVPIKIPVNKELLRLIGYYIAEGSMDEDNYRISFSLNSEEIEYIKDIQQCTERLFHFKPCVDKRKNVTYVDICDKVAYLLFSGVLNLPRGAKKKRVPQIVFNVKQELQREFLKSLIGGDGIFGPRVDYVTSSRLLASDLLYLLLQNGVIGGLSHGRRKVKLPSGRSTRASRFDVYVSAWSELSSINLYPKLREPSRHQRSHRVCMIPTDHIRGILGALSRGSSDGSFVHFGRRTNKEKFEEWLASREKRAKLETLELLREHGSLTSSQVSETLEIPWSTANTRLKSLLSHRLVKRWGRTGHYTYHISSRGFRLLEKIKLARKLFNSHLSFARVREIERVNPSGNYVYDISVPGCENFVAGLGGVICHNTNEKCDSLLRHRTRWMDEISLIVADEVHLLNDAERGPTLEVVLARLMQVNPDAQLLALSATVKNAEEAAEWLKASSVTTEWRPVVLREGVLLQKEVHFKDGGALKIEKRSKNPAINLALHIIRSGGQALIFASTRKNSVSLAKKAAAEVTTLLSKPMKRSLTRVAEEVLTIGERTRISELLAELIRHGSAFHHAGLGGAHRRVIEDAFREGKIKVLTATPTLAFGVNLPARMVVIHDYRRYEPGYGYYPIAVLEYKQMAGRAGRPRYDKIGEALLISKTEDERDYLMESYVLAEPERIWSKLAVERILRSHVLATIAADFAHTEQGIYDFFGKTFYAYQYDPSAIKGVITRILGFLYDEKMIEVSGENVYATRFGRRVSELYIDPVSAVMMRDALLSRANRLTDISFLHMIAHTPDMFPKLRPYSREMDELALFVDEHREEFMFDVPDEWEDRIAYEEFLGEAKLAWVLDAWIEETSEDETIEKFRVQPGDLYRLIETARWLLYASHELAALFGHKDLLHHLAELMERVEKGVKAELLPLVRLKGIGRVRARILYDAGLKSLEDLKRASLENLTRLPLIGPKLAKKIKEQVGGFVKSEEWKRLKKGEAWEQRAITEYEG